MKKTGNSWFKVMFGIAKFVASQAVNYGRTLVVLFQRLHLVLGVEAVGEGRGTKSKVKRRGSDAQFGKRLICMRSVDPILFIVFYFTLRLN